MDQKYLDFAMNLIETKVLGKSKKTEIGSLKYFLGADNNISQSETIIIGRQMEEWWKFVAKNKFHILPSGVCAEVISKGKKTKKDIDLLFENVDEKIIYYFELKANIFLDSEKQKATIEKLDNIVDYLQKRYSKHKIISGILFWSVFEHSDVSFSHKSIIKTFNDGYIDIIFPNEFFKLADAQTTSDQYYKMGHSWGERLKNDRN